MPVVPNFLRPPRGSAILPRNHRRLASSKRRSIPTGRPRDPTLRCALHVSAMATSSGHGHRRGPFARARRRRDDDDVRRGESSLELPAGLRRRRSARGVVDGGPEKRHSPATADLEHRPGGARARSVLRVVRLLPGRRRPCHDVHDHRGHACVPDAGRRERLVNRRRQAAARSDVSARRLQRWRQAERGTLHRDQLRHMAAAARRRSGCRREVHSR
jgi:hypothetical protein